MRQALDGRIQPVQRLVLRQLLDQIDFLEVQLAQVTVEIDEQLAPLAEAVALLETIPCVGHTAATTIIAELGDDMSRFPSAKHLASWAGLCPGNKQSAGKRLGGKTTNGNTWLRAILGEVTWSIAHTSNTYLAAQYHRLAHRLAHRRGRRGRRKAIVAVGHTLIVIIYHMLRNHTPYQDLGADYFERLDTSRLQRHYVQRLQSLGFAVSLSPVGVV